MKLSSFTKSFLGGAAGAALVLSLVFFTQTGHKSTTGTTPLTNQEINASQPIPVHQSSYLPETTTDFRKAAVKSLDAVVHIKTEILTDNSAYNDFFGPFKDYFNQHPHRQKAYTAFGSGVIISSDGYIVTNNHVVEGADKVSVKFNDGHEAKAKIVGVDPSTDLALVKVDMNNLPSLAYGDSDALQVGDWVLAVGNPFNLNSTVTAGIVSAKARNINILGSRSAIESFIQTDAVVNRGNSGGALVNTEGELVGINAAIASHTGVYEGYSFAIPVNIVSKVVDDLMEYGEIQRAYIGVQIQDVDAELAENLGLKEVKGVYINGVVENSGASDAGLQKGDIILSIDNRPTNTTSALMGTIAQYSPGTKIEVRINRDNELKTVKVVLKNQNGTTAIVRAGDSFFNEMLAAELQPVNHDETANLQIPGGLKVVRMDDGILKQGGINKGLILYEINGVKVKNQQNLEEALHSSRNNIIVLKGVYPNGSRISYEFMK
ncbi:MAG: Do family serine endopeptidase [Bacteroidales bacterium]|nr:Do family serine endopeptidase [Bacteroidales bacterium]